MGILRGLGWKFGLPWVKEREAERVAVDERVDVAFWIAPRYRFEYGELENLSVKGARFVSYYKLPRGSRFELDIHFPVGYPSKRSVRLMAKSVYCLKQMGKKRYRIGCEFRDSAPSSLEEVGKFVAWLKSGKSARSPGC